MGKTAPVDRRKVRYLMSRIYGVFIREGWRIRYARIQGNKALCKKHGVRLSTIGFVDDEDDHLLLYIDFRHDTLATIVHECLHVIYPDLEEKEILKLEKFMMDNMSRIQATRLHRVTAEHLI